MACFFAHNIQQNLIYLNPEDSKHCCRVLRYRVGDLIEIVDGKGSLYNCRIINDDFKACVAQIEQTVENYNVRPFKLSIAIAPPKNLNRFEWFIEKAVEIGVEQIIPIATKRSERVKLKMERLNKIALSAIKQSQKSLLPTINEIIDFQELINGKMILPTQKFIAYVPEKSHFLFNQYQGGDAFVFIGPEGGFTEDEINQALSVGTKPVSLGNFRLRTETAGITACQIIATKTLLV